MRLVASSGAGYRIMEVENAGNEHSPLCHSSWYTWTDGMLLATSGDQYGRLQCLDGNHRTCLEDYLLARHLQSILNIFFLFFTFSLRGILKAWTLQRYSFIQQMILRTFYVPRAARSWEYNSIQDTIPVLKDFECAGKYYSARIVKITGSAGGRGRKKKIQYGLGSASFENMYQRKCPMSWDLKWAQRKT